MISLTITRSALSLPDLVITDTPGGDFWIPEDGFTEPEFAWRITYAPDSRYISGKEKLAAARDASSLPVTINAYGADAATLRANMNALVNALGQWSYDTTLTVDGQALGPWDSDPTSVVWFQDSGMVRAHLARATVSIPVNP